MYKRQVERVGVERWLSATGKSSMMDAYTIRNQRNEAVVAIILNYRTRLESLYASDENEDVKRREKHRLIRELKEEYARNVSGWPGYRGYKYWFSRPINNAQLLSVATYNDLVPGFERLLAEHGGDLPQFYEAVRALADMEKPERRAALAAE